jgi:hypothetical protein
MQIPILFFDESGWCEAIKASYIRGPHQCQTEDEYNALKGFARQPVPEINDDETGEKADPIKRALALGVGVDGKAAAESTLKRWALKRLQEAIAEQRTALEAEALTLKVGTAEEIAAFSDEALVAAVTKARE